MNMNNIVVRYRGHTISCAQHKDQEGRIVVQEVMAWGPNVDDEIIFFDSTAPSLIEALQDVINIIDNAVRN